MVIVSGKDRPGITAKFARNLMEHNVEVVDIAQASHQNLL
jgi:predicted amino acid-binding ACT domain protein